MSFIQKCTRLFSRKHHPRLALFFRYLLCFMLGGLLGLIPYFIFLVELCKGLQYSCIQEYAGEMYKIAPSLPFCHASFLLLSCQPLSFFCCCFFLALMLFFIEIPVFLSSFKFQLFSSSLSLSLCYSSLPFPRFAFLSVFPNYSGQGKVSSVSNSKPCSQKCSSSFFSKWRQQKPIRRRWKWQDWNR